MKYEVEIPCWTEGKCLRVEHIEADSPIGACVIAKNKYAPTCPADIISVWGCRCDVCLASERAEFEVLIDKNMGITRCGSTIS